MTLHHPMELAVAGVVCVGKMLGSILGEMVGDIIAEGILDLVKAPFRRGKRTREPTNPEREAEDRRPKLWAEVLAEARSHPPNRSSRPEAAGSSYATARGLASESRWSRRRSVPTTASIHRWLIPKFLLGSAKWCAMW